MKKIFVLITTLFAVTMLTGCGEKRLVCTKSDSESGMEMKSTVEVSYNDDDSFKSVTITTDIKVPEEYASRKSELLELFDNGEEGTTAVETKDGIKVTITGDESLMNEIENDNEDVSYDALKKAFTDEGYSCK